MKDNKRNFTWYGGFQRTEKDNSYNLSDILYFDRHKKEVNRQYIFQNELYIWYNASVKYTETFSRDLSLIAVYNFLHIYENYNLPQYQLDSLGEEWANTEIPVWNMPDGDLLQSAPNIRNSVYSKRFQYNHTVELKLSFRNKVWTALAGIVLRSKQTRLEYQREKIDTSIVNNLFYPLPTVYIKRVFGNFNFDVNYSAVEKYPDLLNMLDYADDLDPLNVSRGNLGLKPSWPHNSSVNLRYYNPENKFSINNNLRFSAASHGISSMLTYNSATGVRTTTPKNVDGNNSLNNSTNTNIHLDKKGYLFLSPAISVDYQRYHNFVQLDMNQSAESATSILRGGISSWLTYRKANTQLILYGGWNGENLNNNVDVDFKEFHYNFILGSEQMFELPLSIRVYSEIELLWNRGYVHSPLPP